MYTNGRLSNILKIPNRSLLFDTLFQRISFWSLKSQGVTLCAFQNSSWNILDVIHPITCRPYFISLLIYLNPLNHSAVFGGVLKLSLPLVGFHITTEDLTERVESN
jgi:hypothetical protein